MPLVATLAAAIALILPQDAWPQKAGAMRLIGILSIGLRADRVIE